MSTIKKLGIKGIKALGLDNSQNALFLTFQILKYPKDFNDYIQIEIETSYNSNISESIRVIIFESLVSSSKKNKVLIDKYYSIKANKFIINMPFNSIAQSNVSNRNNGSVKCYLGISGPNRGAKYSNIFDVYLSENPQFINQSLISVPRKSFTYLSNEQKAAFMAAVLVETSNGRKALCDIAYIYLNLVQGSKSFKTIMNRSSAYSGRKKNYMYKCHHYYITKDKYGEKYGDDTGAYPNRWNSNLKVRDFVEKGDYLTNYNNHLEGTDLNGCIEFMEKKIFISKPITRYNNWEGQGNTTDMNINSGQYERVWDKARQYYWLQKMNQVKEIFVKRLFDRENTSYLYDNISIKNFFIANPNKLPKNPHEIIHIPHYLSDGSPCHKVEVPDPLPNNPKHTKIITYDVELNQYGGIKKILSEIL